MIVDWIINKQILIGMIVAACFFVPWKKRRPYFSLRIGFGIFLLFTFSTWSLSFGVPLEIRLLLYTMLLFLLIWWCFDCNVIHAVFFTTCAYIVQHITSKLTYMLVVWMNSVYGGVTSGVTLDLLLITNTLICIPIYFQYTRRLFQQEQLLFDSIKIVIYSSLFLVAAAFLSVVMENSFDRTVDTYLTSYLALNVFCVLFATTILALEFSNCNMKHLEHENMVMSQLLEYDKQQYEQAKKDMEKIHIRYHDLKQQYSLATEEERSMLEKEMENLNLRYYTGNKAIDIVLTQKAGWCGKVGIQLLCSVDGSCLSQMKHYHIYSMLGNALDNAIECLINVDEVEKKVVTLDISRCRGMEVIRVENYTPSMPIMNSGTIVTTKQNSKEHGYGIKSIQNIAELYGGTASYFVEDQIFYLLITLPFDVQNEEKENRK